MLLTQYKVSKCLTNYYLTVRYKLLNCLPHEHVYLVHITYCLTLTTVCPAHTTRLPQESAQRVLQRRHKLNGRELATSQFETKEKLPRNKCVYDLIYMMNYLLIRSYIQYIYSFIYLFIYLFIHYLIVYCISQCVYS